MTIVVPAAQFENQVAARLTKARGQVQLPGFRPGKVPMKEVRRRFGPAVRAETATEVMRASFYDAVQQESLAPAGSPTLEVVKLAPGDDFEFTATFEVFPRVDLVDFSKLEIAKPVCEITAADIDDMVQRLREQRCEWEDVTRGAQEGDRVTVDFQGTLDGEPFEGGKGESIEFVVGSGRMIEDFDQAVRGLAGGEGKDFPAAFPDDYKRDELAGRSVDFSVTVLSVRVPRLPEVDDDFFRAFGIEEGGLEAFRAEVTGNMRRELDAAIRAQVKGRVMDQLLHHHDVQLPEALVHQEIQSLKNRLLERSRPAAEKSLSLPDELFREQAERQVSLALITREIVRSRELSADPERIRKRIEELAEPYTDRTQVINWYYQDEEQLAGVEMAVLEDQVVDTLLEQAQVSLRESSYADIIAGKMPAEDDAHEADAHEADAAATGTEGRERGGTEPLQESEST